MAGEKSLDGLFTRETEIGQADSFLIQLSGSNLEQLAALIEGAVEQKSLLKVYIGQGSVEFDPTPADTFSAEASTDLDIIVTADPNSLRSLAQRFKEMASAAHDPDYIVHVHLDTYFSRSGIGLSDIVFQRLNEPE